MIRHVAMKGRLLNPLESGTDVDQRNAFAYCALDGPNLGMSANTAGSAPRHFFFRGAFSSDTRGAQRLRSASRFESAGCALAFSPFWFRSLNPMLCGLRDDRLGALDYPRRAALVQ